MKNNLLGISNISLPVSIFFAGAFIGTAIIVGVLIISFTNRYQYINATESQSGCLFDRFTGIKYGRFNYGQFDKLGSQTIFDYKSGKRITRIVDESKDE